jgi:hypothetical protein
MSWRGTPYRALPDVNEGDAGGYCVSHVPMHRGVLLRYFQHGEKEAKGGTITTRRNLNFGLQNKGRVGALLTLLVSKDGLFI